MNPLAIYAGAQVVKTVADLYGTKMSADAGADAAKVYADSVREAGIRTERMTKEQIRHLSWAIEREYDQWASTQEGNWEMERAREMRAFGETGDAAVNRFRLERQQGRMGYEETAADRANLRAELLSTGRTGQGRYAATQRRIGALGALMGTPQPPGGREIAPYVEPTALVQPDWVPLPEPQQTAFTYPTYRQPKPWVPYQTGEEAAGEANRAQLAQAASDAGLTVPEYLRQRNQARRDDARDRDDAWDL